jgi:hypothetical protein
MGCCTWYTWIMGCCTWYTWIMGCCTWYTWIMGCCTWYTWIMGYCTWYTWIMGYCTWYTWIKNSVIWNLRNYRQVFCCPLWMWLKMILISRRDIMKGRDAGNHCPYWSRREVETAYFSPFSLFILVIFQFFFNLLQTTNKTLSSSVLSFFFKVLLMRSGFRSLDVLPSALPLISSTYSLPSSVSYPSMLPFIVAYFEQFCGLVLLEGENIACIFADDSNITSKWLCFHRRRRKWMSPVEARACKILRCIWATRLE